MTQVNKPYKEGYLEECVEGTKSRSTQTGSPREGRVEEGISVKTEKTGSEFED